MPPGTYDYKLELGTPESERDVVEPFTLTVLG